MTETLELLEDSEVPLEYQVFALCFREEGAIEKFAEELPEAYVGAIHGDTGLNEFYRAFLHFYEKTGLPVVDPIAWRAWLETETDIYSALGGPAGVSFFVDLCMKIDLASPESVIKVLKFRGNQRRQMNSLQSLQMLISKKGLKTEEDLIQINELTDQIRSLEKDLNYDPFANVVTGNDIGNRAEALMELPSFIPTPFASYNKALGYTEDAGYFRGAVHAIVAMSGFGKSTFARSLTNYWLDQGYSVLFVNFEEAAAHWERVLMTQIIRENVYARAEGWSSQERKERIAIFKKKLNQWGERFMVRHDPDTFYFEDLELWLRDIIGHNTNVPDIVVIDTIQSMFVKGKKSQRWQEYEQMMVRLEKLAKDMDAAFVITAQQNSEASREKREVLEQRDMGGSIAIVQKASIVTFLVPHKDAVDDPAIDGSIMELQIPKNRITGKVFTNNPPRVQYIDEIKSYVEFTEDGTEYDTTYFDTTLLDEDPYAI